MSQHDQNPSTVNTKVPQKEEKKKRGLLLPLLFLSIAVNIVFIALWLQERGKVNTITITQKEVIVERDNVLADLKSLKEEYAGLQTTNDTLQKALELKRAEIDKLIEEASKHQNDAFIIAKLRKETKTLREIMKHYVHEIDSLNTLNQTIIAEKRKVESNLNTQINKTNELEKDKSSLLQTVSKGSILKAMAPKAMGVRLKGSAKEVDVTKASRVEKIKVSFTLSENAIAKRGIKTVYIHIMAPNGKEITTSESEQNSVEYGGTRGFFAEKKEVEYENAELPVDVFCGSPTGFVPGKYLIDVICDGTIIGQTNITLK